MTGKAQSLAVGVDVPEVDAAAETAGKVRQKRAPIALKPAKVGEPKATMPRRVPTLTTTTMVRLKACCPSCPTN
jgi:hypothetical protein